METRKIKITMLGNVQTGKTCYMSSMYALMSMGYSGFNVSTNPTDDVEFMNSWEQMTAANILPERTKPALTENDPLNRFNLDFSHGGKKVIQFEWVDYRGAAIADSVQDSFAIEEQVKQSDCLFICIPADLLEEPIVNERNEVNNKLKLKIATNLRLSRINQLLNIFQQFRKNKTTPASLAIIITKYDLIFSKREEKEIIRDIKELFSLAFVEGSDWLVMICPFSLGKNIKIVTDDGKKVNGGKEDAGAGKRIVGEVDPVNAHLPISFAIYHDLFREAIEKDVRRKSLIDDKSNLGKSEKQQNLNELKGKWFKNKDDKKKIGQLKDELVNESKALDSLLAQVEQNSRELYKSLGVLSGEIQGIPLYLAGKEVTIDV